MSERETEIENGIWCRIINDNGVFLGGFNKKSHTISTYIHSQSSTHAEFLSIYLMYTYTHTHIFTAKTIIILGKNIKMKNEEQNKEKEEAERKKTVTTFTKII